MTYMLDRMMKATNSVIHQDLKSYGIITSGYKVSFLEARFHKDRVIVYSLGDTSIPVSAEDCQKLADVIALFVAHVACDATLVVTFEMRVPWCDSNIAGSTTMPGHSLFVQTQPPKRSLRSCQQGA